MILPLAILLYKISSSECQNGQKPTGVMGWEEVPPRKGEMECFGMKRYLMILGRTF